MTNYAVFSLQSNLVDVGGVNCALRCFSRHHQETPTAARREQDSACGCRLRFTIRGKSRLGLQQGLHAESR